jgi:diadenosine tetraphosphate (Ap4A) HIT family hydrolase
MTADQQTMSDFRKIFRLEELTVHEEAGWAISVRPGQLTLGSMVVSSSTGRLDFQELDGDAAAGLAAAFARVERLAKERLGAVRVNLVCLMMKDPVVHFHVIPRYDAPIERYGQRWEDTDWPGPPTFGPVPTDDGVLRELVRDLSEHP